jgi:hypothetical protein
MMLGQFRVARDVARGGGELLEVASHHDAPINGQACTSLESATATQRIGPFGRFENAKAAAGIERSIPWYIEQCGQCHRGRSGAPSPQTDGFDEFGSQAATAVLWKHMQVIKMRNAAINRRRSKTHRLITSLGDNPDLAKNLAPLQVFIRGRYDHHQVSVAMLRKTARRVVFQLGQQMDVAPAREADAVWSAPHRPSAHFGCSEHAIDVVSCHAQRERRAPMTVQVSRILQLWHLLRALDARPLSGVPRLRAAFIR